MNYNFDLAHSSGGNLARTKGNRPYLFRAGHHTVTFRGDFYEFILAKTVWCVKRISWNSAGTEDFMASNGGAK